MSEKNTDEDVLTPSERNEHTRSSVDNYLFYQSMVEKYGSWDAYIDTIKEASSGVGKD